MSKQLEQAKLFHQLHSQNSPLIVYNIWDVGSAKALQDTGANVIGTSSWAIAAAQGLEDGENIPFEFILQTIRNISAQMNIPVSVDFESGYSQEIAKIQKNIENIILAGAVGINFEDQKIGSKELYTIKEQCERIHALRLKAEQMNMPLFINARTDIFLEPVFKFKIVLKI